MKLTDIAKRPCTARFQIFSDAIIECVGIGGRTFRGIFRGDTRDGTSIGVLHDEVVLQELTEGNHS